MEGERLEVSEVMEVGEGAVDLAGELVSRLISLCLVGVWSRLSR